MKRIKREITREQYIGVIEDNDISEIFTTQELIGYGVYQRRFYEENGKYYADFMLGDSCD